MDDKRISCDECAVNRICWLLPKSPDNPDGYEPKPGRPRIICLCGSTRFVDVFNEWRKKLTLEGKIVLSIELVLPQSEREDPQHSNFEVKQALDELHLRKIDIADEVFILNKNGYIGESTSREIAYAQKQGKPIKYLEVQMPKPDDLPDMATGIIQA